MDVGPDKVIQLVKDTINNFNQQVTFLQTRKMDREGIELRKDHTMR